ncbi:MAG: hypothetical protein WBP54_09405 [Pelodictyon phaeoclathratiforme]
MHWEDIDSKTGDYEVIYPSRFELRDKQADINFVKAARDIAALISSVTLQRKLNKQFARIALSEFGLSA